MKHQTKLLFLSFFAFCLFLTDSMAQISTTALDSRVIHPFGTAFNPFGRFTGLGESGGVPGPTATGCDLYGFRSQIDTLNAVSLGMEAFGTSAVPVLSFASPTGLFIEEQFSNPLGTGTGPTFGCGKLLALFKEFTGPADSANFVQILFGSGLAVGGTWQPSDAQLKRDIQPIESALDKVLQLNGVTYLHQTDKYPKLGLNPGKNYGFLVQNVREVMPEAVRQGVNAEGKAADYDAMNYDMITPVLVEALKEQQALIQELEARLEQLEAQQGSTPQNPGMENNEAVINVAGVSLRQNRPNPFEGVTTIEYTIPSDMTNARLVIYDINGQALSSFVLAPGNGQLEVDAAQLSSGIYFYSIENQNGQPMARQKMVVK